jgi:hypothetical protein
MHNTNNPLFLSIYQCFTLYISGSTDTEFNSSLFIFIESEVNTMNKDELCNKIEEIYPDIGECGIDVKVSYDDDNERWKVFLKKDNKALETFLEPGDAELCLQGRQCVSLGIEIGQLKDNVGY